MAKVIGITGSIGAGKSAVGEILASLGVPVIDTDKIVHDLFLHDNTLKEKLVAAFGTEIAGGGTVIDRGKLGKIVFADANKRKHLEAIVHPLVLAACRKQVQEFAASPVVAVLVPLLFEAGLAGEYDQVWTVVTNEDLLRERLRDRGGLSESEIEQRLATQLPQSEKAKRSNHVIDNSGSLTDTRDQVRTLLDSSANS